MKQRINSYQDLEAWRKSAALSISVYRVTKRFPADERFGLISQLRRASVSVPSNIAEGWGRGTTNDYARFLRMARGSLYEIETQLFISKKLGFLQDEEFRAIIEESKEAGRILAGLIRSIETKLRTGP